jgi:hypothetical protein
MTTQYDNYAVPIINLPFYYINGAQISNDATTPLTVLDVAAGQMRDSTNTYDLNIGNYNGEVSQTATANVVTLINAAVNGLNGLDTGTLGASKVYNVFVVSDPVSGNPSGAILSLGAPTVGPLMPFGYSAFRHVGYAITDASNHFLLGYNAGNNNARLFMYDAPISVGTTASSASYAAINLTKFVPLVNNIPVYLNVSLSGTANDTLDLQPGNATGNAIVITAGVTSQAQTAQVLILAQNTVISTVLSPTINYKNSGTDTVVITVGGFEYFI